MTSTTSTDVYFIDCTGDVVVGDRIRFSEAVFDGSYRRPSFVGERTIEAEVLRDSYGTGKQQHTFTLRVLCAEGVDAPEPGTAIKRKGRNVYRNGIFRARWNDEQAGRSAARDAARAEKHGRGDAARAERQALIEAGLR